MSTSSPRTGSERSPTLPVACPRCRVSIVSRLTPLSGSSGWACPRCDSPFPEDEGWIDFLPEVTEVGGGIGPKAMQWGPFARIYERAWRPLYMSAAQGRRADFGAEMDWIVDQLHAAHGGTVMDLSCGPGVVGRELVRGGAFQTVFGLDFSPAMLRQCRELCAREGLRDFDCVRGDAGRLPILDASLDGIHAGAALHLWPSVPDALSEVARVLRPGGRFVATTFIHAPRWRGTLSRGFARAMDITFFEPGVLAEACRTAGLHDPRETINGSAIGLTATA